MYLKTQKTLSGSRKGLGAPRFQPNGLIDDANRQSKLGTSGGKKKTLRSRDADVRVFSFSFTDVINPPMKYQR